ncbi:histidine kinase [Pseudonocardia dioxanivorans CB1190]|uniref:histidine kinase n=1 Tax=Pseudonocardia dioxanivorans (strain ATCC 55486 / DSM 44775 / JCM 13855 / CB1190) TaxID=675635 RepID=F4CRY3_PSEUX|nr:histidine kinase [Pseudonocardia dioxanivorans CB1190]
MGERRVTSVDELRAVPLFGELTEEQLGQLAEASTVVAIEPGAELFHEGDPADFWWAVIDGAVELSRHVGREETVVGRMDVPGRWAGGFRAWDERGVYLATARGTVAGRVLRLPSDALAALARKWFPFGSHLIGGLYHTARSIESTARQRQSLVTLGTLAAGLAHEINNPAAAAARTSDALQDTCHALTSSLAGLVASGISAAQVTALDELRAELRTRPDVTSPLALADLEGDLEGWLDDHGVDRGWEIAPGLAAAGADVGWCERVGALLDGPALGPALGWVTSTAAADTLLAELKEATGRISELVTAVKSYSQMDRAARQRVDVTEGLDSTLTMLRHRLADGVAIVRDYAPDLPTIDAYASELNQVWTNLVTNAADAMAGTGTLRVSTRADGGAVVVTIADTGPGMTPEVAARAFDVFFSTKDVGKGTGLGLDIARRIVVERHGGTITIDSAPGRTALEVRLPIR